MRPLRCRRGARRGGSAAPEKDRAELDDAHPHEPNDDGQGEAAGVAR